MAIDPVEVTPAAPDAEPDYPETDSRSALQKVEALLAGQPGEEPEKAPDESQPTETWDLSSLAEKLQATPEKLYALKVPLADGETRTLGELKDGFRTADQVRVERESVQKERDLHDTDKRQTLQDLQSVFQLLPPNSITPELVERGREQHKQLQAREAALMLEKVPEWKDDTVRARDQAAIEALGAEYGWTRADLDGVVDHRLKKQLLDHAKLKASVKATKAAPPPRKAEAPKGRGATPAMEHGRLKAAVTTRRMSPLAAVETLLKGR